MNHSKYMYNAQHEETEKEVQDIHEGHNVLDFKRKFVIALILTIPILFFSPTIQSFFKLSASFSGEKYLLFALSSIVVLHTGFPFYKGALKELTANFYCFLSNSESIIIAKVRELCSPIP